MRIVADANTILSGLFFEGNERRLLVAALHGDLTLLYPEDVVDEVYEVIERTFGDHPDLAEAFDRLESVLAAGKLVPRAEYARHVPAWSVRRRDREDAPVLACAAATEADGVVTGDRTLELPDVARMRIYRTRELLDLLP
ncbi:MAG: PIN domain-containing protein [Methanobacteriota archaeon]